MKRLRFVAVLAAALGGTACGDSTGSATRTITQAERVALLNALSRSGALGAFGSFGAIALNLISEVGSISLRTSGVQTTFSAAGVELVINVTMNSQPVSAHVFGVLAWQGTGSAISKAVVALGAASGAPFTVSLGPGQFDGRSGGIGVVGNSPFAAGDFFFSTAGTFAATSAAFGTATSLAPQGGLTGSYAPGVLQGSFDFIASNSSGATERAEASFATGVPTVKITLTGNIAG